MHIPKTTFEKGYTLMTILCIVGISFPDWCKLFKQTNKQTTKG